MPTPEPLSPATHPASLERTLDSLREAQDTASNVLHCVECPKTFLAGMQNTHQLGVLLVCIAERYSKVLLAVSSVEVGENAALGLRGFGADDKVGEISAPDRGYPGAAAGPRDSQPSISAASSWQLRAKQLVHTEIYGLHSSISDLSDSSDAPGAHTHFTALLDQMERRQNFYHQNPQALPADFPRGAVKGGCGEKAISDEKICLKLVSYARTVVEGLDWGS